MTVGSVNFLNIPVESSVYRLLNQDFYIEEQNIIKVGNKPNLNFINLIIGIMEEFWDQKIVVYYFGNLNSN